ncbi:hypothetical protein Nepgr_028375 [Nepenthes gracilis]|uniref:BRISC complex subunit Abro1 n=1 Tax=Nepenthes gracilis TaxID=150966 RepID=A0AAD3Y222_NEPGR|nr:hypothetical protein Nepgr_028375 [Nepenthes gracilis]
MGDHVLQKVTIPGPTLASLIHRVFSSPGDSDGLLFGRVSHIIPSSLSDDADLISTTSSASSGYSSTLVATVTGFISPGTTCSFYDSSGHLDISSLRRLVHLSNHPLIGWFSARRRCPLSPSLREFSVSQSLTSKTQFSFPVQNITSSEISPCIFLLLTTPFPDGQTPIHSYDYRAYQFRISSKSFDAKPLGIINIGPAFRGHYSAFCPNSQLPYLSCDYRDSPMKEDSREVSESLNQMKKLLVYQKELDVYVEGYSVGSLNALMGSQATNYVTGLEELYEKMLAKLDSLAKLVENSSAKVLEQENHNIRLRYKVAGLE